jgi:argininosuccinate lyase
MAAKRKQIVRQTTVGMVQEEVLAYTAGQDIELDRRLLDADCIGSAAHAVMLSEMPLRPPLFSKRDASRIVAELARIMLAARRGGFRITLQDQDVHLAVERSLTDRLGDLGRKIHTGRSRNDQVAVDLRLFAKEQLLEIMAATIELSSFLLRLAQRQRAVPMVGRTHLQPAMPSSVGLWASAFGEGLLDDLALLKCAYELADQCPLGSAAGYGVPLPLDRKRVAGLLGFRRPIHNVLHASNMRGKLESVVLSALTQVMITLSRLAEDLILFSMPEFAYFELPREFCTGSSIMPQKNNPDVLELLRARAAGLAAAELGVLAVIKGLPSGYNRDLQETKAPFLQGLQTVASSLRVMLPLMRGVRVKPEALRRAFCPAVFATQRALELVAGGMPFRAAYRHIKENLGELNALDPDDGLAAAKHLGAAAGLDFKGLLGRAAVERRFVARERQKYFRAIRRLLGIPYPLR